MSQLISSRSTGHRPNRPKVTCLRYVFDLHRAFITGSRCDIAFNIGIYFFFCFLYVKIVPLKLYTPFNRDHINKQTPKTASFCCATSSDGAEVIHGCM